jgi:uncharacterized protein YeaO (DUF488 family)
MKIVYTSNYSRKGKDSNSYAVSVKPPDYYEGATLPLLAPTWEIVMGSKANEITQEEYTQRYLELLAERELTPQDVADVLPDGCFLLCYEKPTDFCHRHILAEWLNQADGIHVEEWKNEQEQKEQQKDQLVDSLLDF